MPYNPNNPNSDEHNPEGEVPMELPSEPVTTERQKVESCYAHAIVRGQSIHAQSAVAKLEQIYESLDDNLITKEIAITMLDALIASDKFKTLDEISMMFVDKVVNIIRNY
jgi:hypothetical protein